MPSPVDHYQPSRLDTIARARRALLAGEPGTVPLVAPWVERSWRRCLQQGLQPQADAEFDLISGALVRQTAEGNAHLVQTAKPLLEHLGKAIANTGYFAILTNQHGVVVDVNGPIDRSDRRADLITRIGTDLSEQRVGTTAIGSALTELQPVWLHRGEHFFSNTAAYSCAGAPVYGAHGGCVGMLDLTGIDAVERPELCHLVTQVAAQISNAMVLAQRHRVLLRLNWPGSSLCGESDGLVCLDADGWVTGANPTARHMVSGLQSADARAVHAEEVFALPLQMLFDAARHGQAMLELPLWTGLRLHALALSSAGGTAPQGYGLAQASQAGAGLKDMETALIRQTVQQVKGNVARAAQILGISRATVYRKLGRPPKS